MAQAIVTKYIGASNTRGSRVKATAWAGSVTIPYDTQLSSAEAHAKAAEAHAKAAKALASKCGWHGHFIGAGMPDGKGFVFVNNASIADAAFSTYDEN